MATYFFETITAAAAVTHGFGAAHDTLVMGADTFDRLRGRPPALRLPEPPPEFATNRAARRRAARLGR